MQAHVIKAVVKRELASYFSSPTGYVFITIFVFLSAFAAFWVREFFDRNLANLDQLNRWFPALLVFLAPAITMGSWAEERKLGTEELLLTLPARDWELVLGKYLACVSIYAVALVFSLTHAVVLVYLGEPDIGVIASTYLGHFLAGAGLIAVAMVGSALTANLTVAFIVSAVLCAAVVGFGQIGHVFPATLAAQAAGSLSFSDRFEDFGRGVVTLGGGVFFAAVAAVGLWANVMLVGRRHWAGSPSSPARTGLGVVRGVALVVAAGALVVLVSRAPVRADMTAERLWSLSSQTRAVVNEVDPGRPVLVTAYVSSQVPAAYVQTRESLLGLLREIQSIGGGSRVSVRVVPTERFSEEEREAERNFGITARTVAPGPADVDQRLREVFLGVAFVCGTEQVVIPFLARGLPVEYELARSIRTVSQPGRQTVGILDTQAQLFGEFNFRTSQLNRDWPVVDELRKQYDVVQVPRGLPVDAAVDVLIVAQPSTLSPGELVPVLEYIRAGRAAIVMEDPMPVFNPSLGTMEPRGGTSPFGPSPRDREPKADLRPLHELLGIEMLASRVVWDSYNPRPQLSAIEPEFVFVGRGSGATTPINDDDPVTAGLQEVLLACTGEIRASRTAAATLTFTPLLMSSPTSRYVEYRELLTRGQFGITGFNPNRTARGEGQSRVLAARITGVPAAPTAPPEGSDAPVERATGLPINVVVMADLDWVSDIFFELRAEGLRDMEFDNVSMMLNAVDLLAGDESLLALRARRPQHRTLTLLDRARLREQDEALAAAERARGTAEAEIAKARARVDDRVLEIQNRTDLDENTRRIMVSSVRAAEERRVAVQVAAIQATQQSEVMEARVQAQRDIERIQMNIRLAAVLLPPIPALVLAGVVFVYRRVHENAGVSKARLAG